MKHKIVRNPGNPEKYWWEITIYTDITVKISNEDRTLFIFVNSSDHTDKSGKPNGRLIGICSRREKFDDPFNVVQLVAPASLDDMSPENAVDLAEVLKIAADIAKNSVAKNRLAIP